MRIMAIIAVVVATLTASQPLFAQGDIESDLQFAPEDGEESLAPSASPPAPASVEPSQASQPAAAEESAPGPTPPPVPVPVPVPASAQAPAPDGAPAPASAPAEATQPQPAIVPRPPTDLRIFGRHRLRISAAKPRFDDQLKFYSRLYGKEKTYPQFQADWFAWDWYATLGLSFRAAYYSAEGFAAKANKPKTEVTDADFSGDAPAAYKDEAGPTTLTLLPLQVVAAVQFTPFQRKWLVFEGYAGFEYLYWQETRTKAAGGSTGASSSSGSGTSTSTTTNKAAWLMAATTDKGSDDNYTNTGYKKAIVAGAALNILLNKLDERSVASMHGSMGLGYVYLTPFVEVVRPRDEGVSFGRKIYGLGFTFESLR